MRASPTIIVGIGGLALLVGLGLGWSLRASMASADPTPAVPAANAESPRAVTRSAPIGTPAAAPDCTAELAMLRAAYDALEEEAYGTPIPFPEELEPAFQPEGFRAAVDELVLECPELGLSRPLVDCEEYPCHVFFEIDPDTTAGFDSFGLNRCPAWAQRMGDGGAGVTNGSLVRDGEPVRYVGFAPRPADAAPTDADFKRTRQRWDLNREGFAEHIGARAQTAVEQAESTLRSLEHMADRTDEPDRRDFWESQVERQRDKLERLRAEAEE